MTELSPAIEASSSRVNYSLSRQQGMGYILVVLVFLVVFVWGGLAQISSAVVAPGRIVLESSTKKIQHREGGIVRDVLVHDGDQVKAGQVLVRLDNTVAGASDKSVESQIWQLTARRLRLEAERDHKARLDTSADAGNADLHGMMVTEQQLLNERAASRQQKESQLDAQIAQNGHEIAGYQAQIASDGEQIRLLGEELKSTKVLFDKGYAPMTRVNDLEIEIQRLEGDRGQATASVARVTNQSSEIRIQRLQVESDHLTEVIGDLKDTDAKLAELSQQQVTTRDALNRIEIRSPVDGEVQQLAIHTSGGVVQGGETLMLVVPAGDQLLVEAKIDTQHIAEVEAGHTAFMRFTAFDSRTTPQVVGHVDSVSGDAETDEKTGASFYRARLSLKITDLPASLQGRLMAGMPVEVQIQTGRRSAISYLLRPFADQLHRTFKER